MWLQWIKFNNIVCFTIMLVNITVVTYAEKFISCYFIIIMLIMQLHLYNTYEIYRKYGTKNWHCFELTTET